MIKNIVKTMAEKTKITLQEAQELFDLIYRDYCRIGSSFGGDLSDTGYSESDVVDIIESVLDFDGNIKTKDEDCGVGEENS